MNDYYNFTFNMFESSPPHNELTGPCRQDFESGKNWHESNKQETIHKLLTDQDAL